MRLIVPLLIFLLCVAPVGSRGGFRGGFRGGGGRSFGGGGGRGLSGSRSYSGGRSYSGASSYSSGGGGNNQFGGSSNYGGGRVYGWRHSSAPVYMHGGYSYNNYHYYSDKKYLPKDTSVSCTRPTSDLPAAQLKNLTHSTKETPKEMAWACPAGNTCCGWECCKEPVLPSWASGLIVFGIFIGVVILIGRAIPAGL